MGRKKRTETPERLVSKSELMELRGLTEDFIRSKLKHIQYDLGYRTKRYKISEVDQILDQKKTG